MHMSFMREHILINYCEVPVGVTVVALGVP